MLMKLTPGNIAKRIAKANPDELNYPYGKGWMYLSR